LCFILITRTQFDVLSLFATSKETLTTSHIAKITKLDQSELNNTVNELTSLGYITENTITKFGLEALEPYRTKRAIFIAAGFGSRLVPITLKTPKPLITVNGTRIIDTLIDACLEAGIEEIIVVRGYLGKLFDRLLTKYPMIKFVENPYYDKANNISSAFAVRELIQNAYMFESDLFLTNPTLIKKYHYTSEVLGAWAEETDDWCIGADDELCAIDHFKGGKSCYKQAGFYYINEQDGKKYKNHIEQVFATDEGKQIYWEDVIHKYFQPEYRIKIVPFDSDDIVEIDTFEELKAIDSSYSE